MNIFPPILQTAPIPGARDTCAENYLVVLLELYGTVDAALGVKGDLERIVRALRLKCHGVLIRVCADSDYAKP